MGDEARNAKRVRERAERGTEKAGLGLRGALAGAFAASAYMVHALADRLGVHRNSLVLWTSPHEAVSPEGKRLWWMLTDREVLGERAWRELWRRLATQAQVEVTFPDGVGLDAAPARDQVCQITRELGAVAGDVEAAGKVIDAGEARGMLPHVKRLGEEVRELEHSLEEVAGAPANAIKR